MLTVAKRPQAGFRPAPLCRVLLLMAGFALLPASWAADFTETAPPAGLKAGSPKQIFASPFRYDAPDEGADEHSPAVPLEAPRFEKEDYSIGQGVALGNSGSSFRQRGVASWYGRPFHGKKTSSGDSFDMYAMTAAHPSLPIPSYVRVTNVANGRSAVVRINDRGPFHGGRIIDLSYAAAYKLGFSDSGQANVEVALMLPEGVAMVQPSRSVPPLRRRAPVQPAPAAVQLASVRPAAVPDAQVAVSVVPVSTAPAPLGEATKSPELPPFAVSAPAAALAAASAKSGEPVFLQLGAFANAVNAEHFKSFVEHELKWLKASVSVLASEGKYRLQLGPFPSAPEARAIAGRIAATLKLQPVVKSRD